MSKTKITLNGEEFFCASQSIAELVDYLKLDVKKIAIEQNRQIVHPNNFAKSGINAGDEIEIVAFIGGG